jgi:hypothetical protein
MPVGGRLKTERRPHPPAGTPPLRPALDSCVGCSRASHPMRSRLLTPRSFGRGRGSCTYLPADTCPRSKKRTAEALLVDLSPSRWPRCRRGRGRVPRPLHARLMAYDADLRKLHRMLLKKKPPALSVRRRTATKRRVGKSGPAARAKPPAPIASAIGRTRWRFRPTRVRDLKNRRYFELTSRGWGPRNHLARQALKL